MKRQIPLRKLYMLTLVGVWLGAAGPARAWDAAGHMQIADIAWTKLTPRAKKEIISILKAGDTRFRPMSDSESDLRLSFRRAATFADFIKGDHTTDYEPIIPAMNLTFFKAKQPDPSNNEDNTCKTWHYYDIAIRDKGKHPAEESNAINALAMARERFASLEKTGSPDRKMQCWWLYWITHVVGDLHQPLHCVSSYEFFPETGDAGGNRLMVIDPARPDRPSRLHAYWDGGITHAISADQAAGHENGPEEVTKRWEGDDSLKPTAKDASNLDALSWVKSGAALADTAVYRDLKPNSTLTPEYAAQQVTLCKKQAVLAGARLAEVLNAALK